MEAEPGRLEDFPVLILDAALQAIHASETGSGFEGEAIVDLPQSIALAVRTAVVWKAARARVDAGNLKANAEASIKLIEVFAKKK